jgi:hypothetical protein
MSTIFLENIDLLRYALPCSAGAKINFSNIENLVFWAKSEKFGYAVNECHGVLE